MTHLQMLVSSHQNQAARAAGLEVDWQQRKKKWLSSLQALYLQIRTALMAAGVQEDQIQVTRHPISEETLGDYEAEGLQVKIGNASVRFTPVASVIIGGYGRVDVTGPLGEVKLIAEDADPFADPENKTPSHQRQWVWSAYPDKSARGGFRLDDEGLVKVLERVLGSA